MKLNRFFDTMYKGSDYIFLADYAITWNSNIPFDKRIMYQNSKNLMKYGIINVPHFIRQRGKSKPPKRYRDLLAILEE